VLQKWLAMAGFVLLCLSDYRHPTCALQLKANLLKIKRMVKIKQTNKGKNGKLK